MNEARNPMQSHSRLFLHFGPVPSCKIHGASFNPAHPGLQNGTERSAHVGALFGHETRVRRLVDSPLSFVDQVSYSVDWLVIPTISPPFKILNVPLSAPPSMHSIPSTRPQNAPSCRSHKSPLIRQQNRKCNHQCTSNSHCY